MKLRVISLLFFISAHMLAMQSPSAQFQEAHLFYQHGTYDYALTLLNTLLESFPDNPTVLSLKAHCFKETGKTDSLIATCKRMLEIDGNNASAHQLLADGYRLKGNFSDGWREYVWRFSDPRHAITSLDLTKIKGKRVAIHVEGKIGDNIHFVRYAKMLKELGATVIVQANKIVFKLFGLCDYIDEIVSEPIPPVDILLWQQNLPLIFNTTVDTVPAQVPYLYADEKLVEQWRSRIRNTDDNFAVGICWQSSPDLFLEKKPYTKRSIPLAQLSALATVPSVSLYSLQQIDGLDQLATLPPSFALKTFRNVDTDNGPFMDTAAIMKNLDLVITVDTSLAHLAGALGVRVWVMLPYACEWRWMHNRTDSPWYPTMRLFRQKYPGSWDSVVEEVTRELAKLAAYPW